MEKKPNNGDGGEELDRFSTLPEEISHHILFRVCKIQDLARLCCVSTTCRKLALSSPNVCIQSDDIRSNVDECEVRLSVMNSIDRFLLSRGVCKMHEFYLNWQGHDDRECFCANESCRVITWILNALRCEVEVLHIDMVFYDPDEEPVGFPLSVFKCASLRSLWVQMWSGVLDTPSFSFSSNLENLELNDISIADDWFFKWVSCSCKLLKKMSLTRVHKTNTITIDSLSLEDFFYMNYHMSETHYLNISGENIENIHINCCDEFESTTLNLIAPKVKSLTLEGSVINNRNLGDLGCLEKAVICMDPIEDEFDKEAEVFSSLRNVEVLTLNEAVIKTSGFDKMYSEKEDLDFISGVKEVSFDLSGGSNGVEFARYALENGTNLEKMVIRYLTRDSSVEKTFEMLSVKSNLRGSATMSPTHS